jgi:SAM-dependent methyltransferase
MTERTAEEQLADQSYWDDYWSRVGLPMEVKRTPRTSASIMAILDVLEQHLPRQEGLRALEVGGAPGQFLAWLAKNHGYGCSVIDYSPVGCEKARRNFEALGIPLDVYEADLFDDATAEIGRFDVVFSLGLIEHFDDFPEAIRRHAPLARSGGWVVIGCPNLRRLNRQLFGFLRPVALATHNLGAMDVRLWREPAAQAGLETVFAGYAGGFDPRLFVTSERRGLPARAITEAMKLADRLMSRFPALRRLNSRLWSGYAIAVYRKR